MTQRHFENSEALCRYVLDTFGDAILLSFSAGKDSVVAWLRLREMGFKRIVPYYLYGVPNLEFVEQGIRYYEDFFETPVIRIPSPQFVRQLRNLVFQSPEQASIAEAADLPNLTYDKIERHLRARFGLEEAYMALGTRTADSPIRRANVTQHGSLNPNRRTFMPVYDWRIADVRTAVLAAGVKLTVDYRLFGRSFDGIDHRFLKPIAEHYPDDYARILQFFPLAALELKRRTLKPTVSP